MAVCSVCMRCVSEWRVFWCVVQPTTAVIPSASICHQFRQSPVLQSRVHYASHGAWKQRVQWTRMTWCVRLGAFSMTITVTTNSANDSSCYARTQAVPARATPLSSGKWRSANCRGCRWTAYGLSVSPEHQLGLKTSHQKLLMNCSYNLYCIGALLVTSM